MNTLLTWITRIFSAEPGASFSRMASFIVLVASVCWITHIVFYTHDLPDPSKLVGITVLISSLYALGKASDVIARTVNNKGGNPK